MNQSVWLNSFVNFTKYFDITTFFVSIHEMNVFGRIKHRFNRIKINICASWLALGLISHEKYLAEWKKHFQQKNCVGSTEHFIVRITKL